MSDRSGPFDNLNEETEQNIEQYEVNDGVVDTLVAQAKQIIQDEDNHRYGPGAMNEFINPPSPESLLSHITVPPKEVHSADLSAALIRIANLRYQDGGEIQLLKGNISSALLVKLDEAYPKHWDIRLAGVIFNDLFNGLWGIDSLHISNCAGTLIGSGIRDTEYICFENVDGDVGESMQSVGAAVFKNINKDAGLSAEIENALFLQVSEANHQDVKNAILHDVSVESMPKPHSIQVDSDRPQTAYIRSDPSSKDGDRLTTILYDAYAGVLVSQNAAETVRPLTDKEHRVIEELAGDSPPDKQEVTDAIATLNKEADNDG